MHESGDPHALRSSLHASCFHLGSFHEFLDGLSVPLLNIVDFDGIFDVLVLMLDACAQAFHCDARLENFSSDHLNPRFHHGLLVGTAKSSSSVDLCLFDLDFQCPPSLVLLSDTRDNGDSLFLPFSHNGSGFCRGSGIHVRFPSRRRSGYDRMILRRRESLVPASLLDDLCQESPSCGGRLTTRDMISGNLLMSGPDLVVSCD
ncbi:hypothetical protein Tco_0251960 [Tanacetum coccineum]